MTVTFIPALCYRNGWIKIQFNPVQIQLYSAESLHGEIIHSLVITEHSVSYKEFIRLLSNKHKQTTHKSPYNDTKASVLQSRALSFQWYTTLDYSRRRDEINTKSFVLMHQQMYNKTSLSESRWSKLSLKFTVTYMKKGPFA